MENLLEYENITYYNQDISTKSSIYLLYNLVKNNPTKEVIKDLLITSNILLSKEPNNVVLKNAITFFLTNLHPINIENIAKEKKDKIIKYLEMSYKEITANLDKKIKKNSIVFIHSINNILLESLLNLINKKNVEIRILEHKPLGKLTIQKLLQKKAKVKEYTDLDIKNALENADYCLIGGEGIIKNKAIAKKGSELVSYYTKKNKIPLYVLNHSLKYTDNIINIDEKKYDLLEPEHISAYICEYGILKPDHIKQEIKFHNSKLFY